MKKNITPLMMANICVEKCQRLVAQIENAKNKILMEFRELLETHEHLLHLALNEAEALAWQTPYPHLVFADLAAEKAQAVAQWSVRQRLVRGTPAAIPLEARAA
jgi:hypothetical protein